jgi:hypothetical protein
MRRHDRNQCEKCQVSAPRTNRTGPWAAPPETPGHTKRNRATWTRRATDSTRVAGVSQTILNISKHFYLLCIPIYGPSDCLRAVAYRHRDSTASSGSCWKCHADENQSEPTVGLAAGLSCREVQHFGRMGTSALVEVVEGVEVALVVLRDRKPTRIEVVREKRVVGTPVTARKYFEGHGDYRRVEVGRKVVAMIAEDPWRRSNHRQIRGRRGRRKGNRATQALKCRSNDIHVE